MISEIEFLEKILGYNVGFLEMTELSRKRLEELKILNPKEAEA